MECKFGLFELFLWNFHENSVRSLEVSSSCTSFLAHHIWFILWEEERICATYCLNPYKAPALTRVTEQSETSRERERAKVQFSRIAVQNLFSNFTPSRAILIDSTKAFFFCLLSVSLLSSSLSLTRKQIQIHAQLKGKIKVRAEKNLNKIFFSLFFLEWPRARDEKSRGWNFFHFITISSSQLWFSNCQLPSVVHREQSHFPSHRSEPKVG